MRFSIMSLLFPFTVNAALSATTANTIMGTKPILSKDGGSSVFDLNTVLGFTMPDNVTKYDNTHTGSITISSSDAFSKYTTFVTADGNPLTLPPSYYYDADGDIPADTLPVEGTVTATWLNDGKPITDLTKKPSVCEGPYTLKIETTNVMVKSKYGNPLDNNYGTVPKTYNFIVEGYSICNLKPLEMSVYSNLTSTNSAFPYQSTTNPGGYNPATWDYDSTLPAAQRHKGFKASSDFPTTGFAQAKFQMVMSGGNQGLFTFSSSDNINVPIDSSGNVVLLGKPSGSVTLTATLKSDTSKKFTHTFTISKWALLQSNTYEYSLSATNFPALNRCRTLGPNASAGTTTWQQAAGQNPEDQTWRNQYLYTRAELTNAPSNTMAMGSTATGTDRFSRDTGTFTGEWGVLFMSYGNTWHSTGTWTSEAWTTSGQFILVSSLGYIAYEGWGISRGVACRG